MSINLYPDIVHESDLTPEYSDEINEACQEIHKACKGFGTDEKSLNAVFGLKTATQRLLIAHRYVDLYEKSLYDVIKSETSGNYGTLLQFLSLPIPEAEALMIDKATSGMGTNEKLLYPIICGRSNADMNALKKAFYKRYSKDLSMKVDSEVGGDFRKLLVSCLAAAEEEFDPTYHTAEKAMDDAKAFYKAGQGKWGTDEKAIFKIISLSPPKHLEAVEKAYGDKYGYTLTKALEKELSGTAKKAAVFTVDMKLKPYEAIAHLIKSTCAGFGTDELGLSCCMVRYEHVINSVMIAHEELFGKTLLHRIKSETKGNYRDLLCALTGLVE